MSLFLDLVLLAVLVMFVVLGAKKGFIRALLDGFSTLIAGVLAYTFVEPASQYAYDAFVRNMVRNSLSNALNSTTNDFGSITEKVEILIDKIPESAINFSAKFGFIVDAVADSIIKSRPSDKEVLIDTIMTDTPACTTEMLGVRENTNLGQMTLRFSNQRRDSKTLLDVLCPNIFFQNKGKLYPGFEKIALVSKNQEKLITNYIHNSDGKKRI